MEKLDGFGVIHFGDVADARAALRQVASVSGAVVDGGSDRGVVSAVKQEVKVSGPAGISVGESSRNGNAVKA